MTSYVIRMMYDVIQLMQDTSRGGMGAEERDNIFVRNDGHG